MKPIVSFDIDMTLLDHKTWKVPESAMRAVRELRKSYYIVVATGRDMDSPISADIRDQLDPDAIIHMNGTKITVGSDVIYDHRLDRKLLGRILEYAKGEPFSVGASIAGRDYYTNQEVVIRHDLDFWGNSRRQFAPAEELLRQPVRTLAYIGDREAGEAFSKSFPEIKLLFFAGNKGADLVERGASKAEGLKRLCSHFQCDIKQCVAFGDSMNDIDIIKEAGIGVAMGNAIEELKTAADYITTEIDKDGVWNACLELGLLGNEKK